MKLKQLTVVALVSSMMVLTPVLSQAQPAGANGAVDGASGMTYGTGALIGGGVVVVVVLLASVPKTSAGTTGTH